MDSSDRKLEATRLVDDIESMSLEERFNTYEETTIKGRKHKGILTCGRVYVAILHIIILMLAGVLLNYGLSEGSRSPDGPQRSWSPVQGFVEYKVSTEHATDPGHYSVYSGPPSEEQEEAWDRLITPVYFNISRDELTRAGESFENIIELTEGGYIASLGVYHELHCLRNLRLYVFRDRYYPNLTESQDRYLKEHLETLRISAMCHGNTAINSYKWDTETIDKPLTKSNSRSVCVKWSSIEDWSYSRRVFYVPPVRWPSQNQAS
ncbi:hypothetical protein E0Z10_g9486 [Xylaria hypoxylon]|uniref:Tat pathway signal sequence protein n=1 Tax=Xylaria hypoxylon TaxID=37992 RepID=A0A4Z0Y8J6_9PEZI|nr:hypothetical protein E0Z10_g9486 [Xylaria hypoxylon]